MKFSMDMSDFDSLADRLKQLGRGGYHRSPEFHHYLTKQGIRHVGGDEYTLVGHDIDRDLTPEEESSVRRKFQKAVTNFTQDVLSGKTKFRKTRLGDRLYTGKLHTALSNESQSEQRTVMPETENKQREETSMADRRVKCTGKDEDGDITSLGNSNAAWSPVPKNRAISQIEVKTHSYYVEDGEGRSDVEVVDGQSGKYLRTDPNGDCGDNLGSLPDC